MRLREQRLDDLARLGELNVWQLAVDTGSTGLEHVLEYARDVGEVLPMDEKVHIAAETFSSRLSFALIRESSLGSHQHYIRVP